MHDDKLTAFMQVYSGKQFFPFAPEPEDIDIIDVAHSLSLQTRYAGHCIRFYSVAEHSLHVAWWVYMKTGDRRLALAGLLHDGPEAYLVDIIRPIKPHLQGYRETEDAIWRVFARKFGLDVDMPAIVKEADNRILSDEREQNMRRGSYKGGWPDLEPLGIDLQYWRPEVAEEKFLTLFEKLAA